MTEGTHSIAESRGKEKTRCEFEKLVYDSLSEDIFEYLDKGKLTENEIVEASEAAVYDAVSNWVLDKITHVERVR
ncbi:hypothetical protein B488_09020 [Liberibacter crescens BT-1]|uniref:Uncharacterized protein n=1 Tax=Liberibacter crescens (strain BT-1) TaxID=1215343 RepID=L0ETM1_LIBCB|nr:hypothetical protein [Liberibacter crescens]AGA64894.1 hypothetical protein B488_09020 [Liberibacter crescens BT-1]AMC12927.1 hypothetical protein RL73_04560 [Liberibacter crescens]